MAEEEKVEGEEKPKKKLPKLPIKLLAFVAGIVAILVLVVIVASIVAKSVKQPIVEFGPEAPPEKKEAPPILKPFLVAPEFIARLADEEESRLVKTGEFYLAFDPNNKELPVELDKRKFEIRDIINTILISKTSKDLSSEEGKNKFKQEVMDRINARLTKGQIEDVYVEIIIQ